MKKIVLGVLILALSVVLGATALAAGNDVTVSVDRRTIDFSDQQPIIENDRVLVPLRGVFEAMDATVLWNQEKQQITIFSSDNVNRLILTLNQPEFTRITFKSLFSSEKDTFISEVAPKAVNGRTMVPIYLIADYMYNDAEWIPETRHVKFTSKKMLRIISKTEGGEDALYASLPKLSIASDAKNIRVGDTVSVKVKLSNVAAYSEMLHLGMIGAVNYDNKRFEYSDTKLYKNGEEVEPGTFVVNPYFRNDSVKFTYFYDNNTLSSPTEDTILELFFIVKDENGGEFRLSDRFTQLGYDTNLILSSNERVISLEKANQLYLDTTPIYIR